MLFNLTPIYNFFSGLVGKFFTDMGLKFAAYKALIYSFLTVTLPIIFKNFINWIFVTIFGIITANMDTSDINPIVLTFTGVAGYMVQEMFLIECLVIIISGLAIRFILNFIPFVG